MPVMMWDVGKEFVDNGANAKRSFAGNGVSKLELESEQVRGNETIGM